MRATLSQQEIDDLDTRINRWKTLQERKAAAEDAQRPAVGRGRGNRGRGVQRGAGGAGRGAASTFFRGPQEMFVALADFMSDEDEAELEPGKQSSSELSASDSLVSTDEHEVESDGSLEVTMQGRVSLGSGSRARGIRLPRAGTQRGSAGRKRS